MSKAIEEIAAERQRQIDVEGWTPEHDDAHSKGEMASAASAYALSAALHPLFQATPGIARATPPSWPKDWHLSWFKPTTPRRDLVKAAALIVAEIERLDRAAGEPS